jgi:phosphoglycerate dehydrogenase-like enzyme
VRGNNALHHVHFWTSQVPDAWRNAAPHIRITDSRGINADSVADHGSYLLYRALRREPFRTPAPTWNPDHFGIADDPAALTLGIMGCGEIGQRLARRFGAVFGNLRVLGRKDPPAELQTSIRHYTPAHDFLAGCDYLVITLPLSLATKAYFDETFYRQIKPSVTIVNLARGELFDEVALTAFLDAHPDSRYLSDVAVPEPYPSDGPLLCHPGVFMTPHIGGRQAGIWSRLEKHTLAILSNETGCP